MLNNILEALYPSFIWRVCCSSQKVYITFDDGPDPEITPLILDILEKYNAKATFFCLGELIEKNYDLYLAIISRGHSIGSHGYKHLNGWTTSNAKYIDNAYKASQITLSGLFRPPYGKMTAKQIKVLRNDFDIIMWTHLSKDYKKSYTPEKCFKRVTRNLKKGSIILFHDNQKAKNNVIQTLPMLLEYIKSNGYITATL